MYLKYQMHLKENFMKNQKIVLELDNKKKFNCVINYENLNPQVFVIIAHGANNDMNNYLLRELAFSLCSENIACLRFNFPYRYENRKSPDSSKILMQTWQKVYEYVQSCEFAYKKIVTIGKSLGGRTCAEAFNNGLIKSDLFVFLGYPLHAPGRADKLKDQPLYNINIPMFFVAGTKDPLCNKAFFDKVFDKIKNRSKVYFIDGAGHALCVGDKNSVNVNVQYDELIKKIVPQIIDLI